MPLIRALVFAVLLPLVARADNVRLGEQVFWKMGAKATADDGSEVAIENVRFPSAATKHKGGRFWLETAWVAEQDVMLLPEAFAWYAEAIRAESRHLRALVAPRGDPAARKVDRRRYVRCQ